MTTSQPVVAKNPWAAILSDLPLLLVPAGFVYTAMTPTDDWHWSSAWVLGLILLAPAEFARSLVLSLLGDALKDGKTPAQAVRIYLHGILVMVILLAFVLGPGAIFSMLTNPGTVIPILVVVGDGTITLFNSRGDPQHEAAQISAVVDDNINWLQMSISAAPVLVPLIYLALSWLRNHGVPMPPSIPPPGFESLIRIRSENPYTFIPDWIPNLDILRCAAMLNIAFYFAFKGVIIANVKSARFARTGKRLLAARWIRAFGSSTTAR